MTIGLAVLVVGVPIATFFIWVARNGLRTQEAEREERRHMSNCHCRCRHRPGSTTNCPHRAQARKVATAYRRHIQSAHDPLK
ncbi:hypothetical protein AEMCBJ_14840 [Cupriavidus necator]